MKFDLNNNSGQILSFLANQISDIPIALFPYNKRWRRIIPHEVLEKLPFAERFFFAFNQNQLMIFFVYDDSIDLKNSARISEKRILALLRQNKMAYKQHQYIFICDRKQLECTQYMLKFNNFSNALLIYEYGQLSFAVGSFQNQTLNNRLRKNLSMGSFYPSTSVPVYARVFDAHVIQQLMLDIIQTCIYCHAVGKSQITTDELIAEMQVSQIGNKYSRSYKIAVRFILDKMSEYLQEKIPDLDLAEYTDQINFMPALNNSYLLREFGEKCASKDFFSRLTVHQAEIEQTLTE